MRRESGDEFVAAVENDLTLRDIDDTAYEVEIEGRRYVVTAHGPGWIRTKPSQSSGDGVPETLHRVAQMRRLLIIDL